MAHKGHAAFLCFLDFPVEIFTLRRKRFHVAAVETFVRIESTDG